MVNYWSMNRPIIGLNQMFLVIVNEIWNKMFQLFWFWKFSVLMQFFVQIYESCRLFQWLRTVMGTRSSSCKVFWNQRCGKFSNSPTTRALKCDEKDLKCDEHDSSDKDYIFNGPHDWAQENFQSLSSR